MPPYEPENRPLSGGSSEHEVAEGNYLPGSRLTGKASLDEVLDDLEILIKQTLSAPDYPTPSLEKCVEGIRRIAGELRRYKTIEFASGRRRCAKNATDILFANKPLLALSLEKDNGQLIGKLVAFMIYAVTGFSVTKNEEHRVQCGTFRANIERPGVLSQKLNGSRPTDIERRFDEMQRSSHRNYSLPAG